MVNFEDFWNPQNWDNCKSLAWQRIHGKNQVQTLDSYRFYLIVGKSVNADQNHAIAEFQPKLSEMNLRHGKFWWSDRRMESHGKGLIGPPVDLRILHSWTGSLKQTWKPSCPRLHRGKIWGTVPYELQRSHDPRGLKLKYRSLLFTLIRPAKSCHTPSLSTHRNHGFDSHSAVLVIKIFTSQQYVCQKAVQQKASITNLGHVPISKTANILRLVIGAWAEFIIPENLEWCCHGSALPAQQEKAHSWRAASDNNFYEIKHLWRKAICKSHAFTGSKSNISDSFLCQSRDAREVKKKQVWLKSWSTCGVCPSRLELLIPSCFSWSALCINDSQQLETCLYAGFWGHGSPTTIMYMSWVFCVDIQYMYGLSKIVLIDFYIP